MSSVTRWPRSSCLRVDSSRSEANCANAASSRYCASARRTPPPVSLRFMILVCAAPPTRDTETPALIAGRMPALKRAGLALDRALGELLDVSRVHARGALEQPAVQVEHVAWIGFAARRAAQQQ